MKTSLCLAATVVGFFSLSAAPLQAQTISVIEAGVGANEIVNISSSTLGNDLEVYACALQISVDGTMTFGFCIDPWHWSLPGTMTYTAENLGVGPKLPGPMGSATALQVEQLWAQYYSPNLTNDVAAGLQIAIWDLVSASVSAVTDGASWFTLNSGDDYGASSMIAWVDANPNAAAANLSAITGPGQDYVVQTSVLPQLPPSAVINAAPTAFTGSPFTVTSSAAAPDDNLTLHSIEWLSPTGDWTVSSTTASGASDDRSLGITFPVTGVWTLRAGASVDNGNTWVYSASVPVNVSPGITNYTLQTMAVPNASVLAWYSPSSVVEKNYEVQHLNP